MRFNAFKKWRSLFFADRIVSVMLLLALFFLLATLFSVVIPNRDVVRYDTNAGGTVPIGELYDGQNLEMKYLSSESGLMGMSFTIATYGRVLTEGTVHICLTDKNAKEIFCREFEGSSIEDNSVIDISFPEQSDSNNKEYTVRIYTSGIKKDYAITFWANENKLDNISTTLGDAAVPNTMVLSTVYNSVSYRYTWDLFLLFDIFFVMTIVAYGRKKDK